MIEKRAKERGGIFPRDVRDISKAPSNLLAYAVKTGKLERKNGKYVIKETMKLAEPKVVPFRSTETELWSNFLQKRRDFRKARKELYAFLSETR